MLAGFSRDPYPLGVCHSDIHQSRDEWGGSLFPMVPGHEIVGTVVKAGLNVTKWKVGDTQEMLDFCAEHRVASDVEVIPIQSINEAYERVLKSDVHYRFVIDMSSLKKSKKEMGIKMNIFDFAMKMELVGKKYYEQLAADTDDGGLKNIFTSLAADEQKHYEIISAIKSGTDLVMADSRVLDEAKNLFEILSAEKSNPVTLKRSLDGYQHARKIEADSVRLYEEMAKKEDNPETVQLLLRIANEEKKHFNILDNLYEYVLAPQNYLAWGEFSNLKEF